MRDDSKVIAWLLKIVATKGFTGNTSGDVNRLSASRLLECIAIEQRRLAGLSSLAEQRLCANVIEVLGKLLVNEASSGRAGLTAHIDAVLNGAGAPTWAPRNGGRPNGVVRRDAARGGEVQNGRSGGSRNGGTRRGRKRKPCGNG